MPLSILRSVMRGEFVRIYLTGGNHRHLYSHFPVSAIGSDGQYLKSNSVAVTDQPEFYVKPEAADGDTTIHWLLMLKNRIHEDALGSAKSVEDDDSHLSRRAKTFIYGPSDIQGKEAGAISSIEGPFEIARFRTEKNARIAMSLAISAAIKAGLITKSAKIRSELIQKHQGRKWLKVAGMTTLGGVSLAALLVVTALIHDKNAIATVATEVSREVPNSNTAIRYGTGGASPEKTAYVFTDPSCKDCRTYQPAIATLQNEGFDVWVFPIAVMSGSKEVLNAIMCSEDKLEAWNHLIQSGALLPSRNTKCITNDAGSINAKLFDAFNFKNVPATILGNGVIFEGVKSSDEILKLIALKS